MSYELILFDADDTLFDYSRSEAYALSQTFAHAGIEAGEAVVSSYRAINQRLWNDYEQGNVTLDHLRVERFRRLFEEYGLAIEAPIEQFGQAYARHLGEGIFLIDGADELCRTLREGGVRLAIITNGIKEVQLNRIRRSGMDEFFEHIIVSEDAGEQKPNERFFDYTFEKLKMNDKHRALIVGDTLSSDIAGGHRYGVDTCWFNPWGRANKTDIEPTYEIRQLSELLSIVGGRHERY